MLKYYQQELYNLRNLAKKFSEKHPAAAPLLSAETADPDVERLLEGVAFLTGLLRKKLDDDFPEIIHNLAEIIFPHALRPIPSVSIVSFFPKPALREKLIIKKGISIASNPVEDISCIFRTCFDLEIHPIRINSVRTFEEAGKTKRIVLRLNSLIPLSQLNIDNLTFFLGGSFNIASDLFMLLDKHLNKIILKPLDKGDITILYRENFLTPGFSSDNALIPFSEHVFSGFRLLQEYFIHPQKFLFIGINGWEKWRNRGNGTDFEIIFELENLSYSLPKISEENFVLFATPVINIFPMEIDPVYLDHTKDKILIKPPSENLDAIQIYEIIEVKGYEEGVLKEIKYNPFNMFKNKGDQEGVYYTIHSLSPVTGKPEIYIRILYSENSLPLKQQTLTVKTLCFNGEIPNKLHLGDICKPTTSTPELVTFRNIIPVTSPIEPLLTKNKLWNFLSHLSLNLLSLANLDGFKKLLTFYAFPDSNDKIKVASNLKKIDGIEGIDVENTNRLIQGLMLMGIKIFLTIRKDHFASDGDLYLFGSVLNEFFSQYSHINTFTQLEIKDSITGAIFRWKERLGKRFLF